MNTNINRLFQSFYIVLISIISIFNISLIYLIDTNDEHNMNDHDENTINESMDEYSETVAEIPCDPVVQAQCRQIDMCIAHAYNKKYVRFGQTQPCHPVELLFIKIQKLINGRRFCIFLIFLGICIYCKHFTPKVALSRNTSLQVDDNVMFISFYNTDQDFIMKEQNVVVDDKINSHVKDNNMLTEISAITLVDNLVCTLYDVFLNVFTPLFCWKDDIQDFTPTEPPDDIHSFYDSNEK
ncbi:unnamed protein product, partial [Rotaria sp. Silwood2]